MTTQTLDPTKAEAFAERMLNKEQIIDCFYKRLLHRAEIIK